LEHLLSAWPEIVNKFKEARHILLLSDFDGTLAPIAPKPEMANLPEETRSMLKDLAHQRPFTLGIISGRELTDLKNKVGITGIIYAGNHGLEIEGPGIAFVNPIAEELKPVLHIMHRVLSEALRAIKGVFVENKGLSLSVHYRLAEENQAVEVERIVKQVAGGAEAAGQAKITSGKKVYEVRPAVKWDKGKAINLLISRYGESGRRSGLLAAYFGDDVTDNDGFRVIEDYGNGISVFVGEETGQSNARFFLKSPAEVTDFLGMLYQQYQKGVPR
jgi:trehalose 6-phosphate phosphatase